MFDNALSSDGDITTLAETISEPRLGLTSLVNLTVEVLVKSISLIISRTGTLTSCASPPAE